MEEHLFAEKVAVVTGASRGLGRAVAEKLVARGACVVMVGRDAERLAQAVAGLTAPAERLLAVTADVAEEGAVQQLFAQTVERFHKVDLLINNAGLPLVKPLGATLLEEWNAMMAVHATATFLTCREAVRLMTAQGLKGKIVNISSVSGASGAPMATAYSAAKAAVLGFTRALAKEVARRGINVNAICPGAMDTAMFREGSVGALSALTGADPAKLLAATLAAIPLGRLLDPAEVAELVLFLGSERAAGITGQTYSVCGGFDIH